MYDMCDMDIEPGDLVQVGNYVGILMPKHEFSDEDIVVIKLNSGYNIGIKAKNIKLLEKQKYKYKAKELCEYKIEFKEDKNKIYILSTGGTIASYVDYRTGAVYPALDAKTLCYSYPELSAHYNIDAKVIFSEFSENITLEHWQTLAKEIYEIMKNKDCTEIIVTHGTDTLHYTATALAFFFKKLICPIVMVGAMRSSDRPSTDAKMNLLHSTKLSNYNIGEVMVVMHATVEDSCSYIHYATKVRKMHSSRRDAFKSINTKPLGKITDTAVEFFLPYRVISEIPEINTEMNKKVALIYFYPNMDYEYLEWIYDRNDGVVIAGTGLGHIAEKYIYIISNAYKNGKITIMTTQCFSGTTNLRVYATGRDLIKAGVIEGMDMLPEVAYIKLMHILAQTNEYERVKELMQTPLAWEITYRHFGNSKLQ